MRPKELKQVLISKLDVNKMYIVSTTETEIYLENATTLYVPTLGQDLLTWFKDEFWYVVVDEEREVIDISDEEFLQLLDDNQGDAMEVIMLYEI